MPELAPLLWEHYRRDIERGIKGGMASWLKEKLLARQFESHDAKEMP